MIYEPRQDTTDVIRQKVRDRGRDRDRDRRRDGQRRRVHVQYLTYRPSRVSSLPPVSCSQAPLTYWFYVLSTSHPAYLSTKAESSRVYLILCLEEDAERGLLGPGHTIEHRYIQHSYPEYGEQASDGQLSHSGSTSSSTATPERGITGQTAGQVGDLAHSPCLSSSVHHPLLHTQAYCGYPPRATTTTTETTITNTTLLTNIDAYPRTTHSPRPSSNAATASKDPYKLANSFPSHSTSMGRPLAGLIAYCRRRPWRRGRGLTRTDVVRAAK